MKKKYEKIIKSYVSFFVTLFLMLILVIIFSKIVPYNMDEFLPYHTIICHHYSYNSLNTFRENCDGYDLNFLNTGIILPLRTFNYVGSFPSIYYYPIFLIWKSPLSARFVGLLFLLIQSILISKIFKIKYTFIFIGLIIYFPYFFQHIADIGPIAFQTTSIFILYYLFKRWFDTIKLKYPILISLVIFAGIWTKLSYIWYIPGIFFIFLIVIFENKNRLFKEQIKEMFLQLLISSVILICLLISLFFSTNPKNSDELPYLNQLSLNQLYSSNELFRMNIMERGVFKALINPFEATQKFYYTDQTNIIIYIYDIFIFFSVPLFWIFLIKYKGFKKEIFISILMYITFLLTFFFIFSTKNSWAMHHTIFSIPFLILSFFVVANILKKTRFKIFLTSWILIFFILNIFFFLTFPSQTIKSNDDKSKIEINSILQDRYLSKNYFYVVIDWGMYYYQGLYGNKLQSVLYMQPLNKQEQIDQLKNLSVGYDRKILFIFDRVKSISDEELITSNFNLRKCNLINENLIWNVLLEPDNNTQNICFLENDS